MTCPKTAMESQHLDNLRHSCAHLLAAAVKNIWPQAKNAIGPPIEEGFYQDFDMGEVRLSEADLPKIEKRMRQLLKTWKPFIVNEVSVAQAKKDFADNPYKLELIDELAKLGKTITENDPGNFLDLCKGGHAENPQKDMQHFKLLSLAGAYWRGDEKNKMLTRIYGTCFATQAELESYLTMLKEAEKRDHKKLGPELDLFTFSDLVGSGLPLWTPKGMLMRTILNDFVWELRRVSGYERVEIPHITKKDLYERSGHWDKFKDELFKINTREGHELVMKPMNCPHHTQIYARRQWSYRELPQRYENTTMVYRDEQTGELSGLSRVRSITQDDAHVFCRSSQAVEEMSKVWDIVTEFYRACGFNDLIVRLSFSDPAHMEKYLGTPAVWQEAEKKLTQLVKQKKATATIAQGEAAFYGPKIDFMAKDSLGREWQVATIQLDMNMPERFDLSCINEDGKRERIVMVHAAIMGSIERCLSILIEHYAGAFPVWLAPVQVYLASVGSAYGVAVRKLRKLLVEKGIRVEIDDGDDTVGYKVRKAEKQKVPYVLVVGDKEKSLRKLTVRIRGQEKQPTMSVNAFIKRVQTEIEKKK